MVPPSPPPGWRLVIEDEFYMCDDSLTYALVLYCFFPLVSVGNYVLQYLGNRLTLTPFVTQSLVQVSQNYATLVSLAPLYFLQHCNAGRKKALRFS